eukprot:2072213-Amphidinium_carterae.1
MVVGEAQAERLSCALCSNRDAAMHLGWPFCTETCALFNILLNPFPRPSFDASVLLPRESECRNSKKPQPIFKTQPSELCLLWVSFSRKQIKEDFLPANVLKYSMMVS